MEEEFCRKLGSLAVDLVISYLNKTLPVPVDEVLVCKDTAD